MPCPGIVKFLTVALPSVLQSKEAALKFEQEKIASGVLAQRLVDLEMELEGQRTKYLEATTVIVDLEVELEGQRAKYKDAKTALTEMQTVLMVSGAQARVRSNNLFGISLTIARALFPDCRGATYEAFEEVMSCNPLDNEQREQTSKWLFVRRGFGWKGRGVMLMINK